MDHPGTVSQSHHMIAGETFLIAGRPGRNEDESADYFMKTNMIAGNHKSIFVKEKNTFAKRKNQNDLSGNRFFVPRNRSCGNILQEAGNKLKNQGIILLEAGNKLQED